MIYLKATDDNNGVVSVEAIENPVFVEYQQKNNIFITCAQKRAQGIVSKDGENIYRLVVGMPIPSCLYSAVLITESEYDEWKATHPDIIVEDDPSIEEESEKIEGALSRAELTEKVLALEEQNSFLTDCILEMSEVIYA